MSPRDSEGDVATRRRRSRNTWWEGVKVRGKRGSEAGIAMVNR